MKQILLLTDFSENSKNAIYYALQLFKDQECSFHLLNTHKPVTSTTSDLILSGNKSVYNSLVENAHKELDKLAETLELKFKNKKHAFKTSVDFDTLTDAVNQMVLSKKIDLIVMGSNGATGAREVLFGSNTLRVIRHVKCTTLVIPEGFMYKKPENILLPLDLNDSLSNPTLIDLYNFIKKHQSNLHVLRITPDNNPLKNNEDLECLKSILKNTTHSYNKVNNVPFHFVVDSYLQFNNIDLMALLVQDESVLELLFIGDTTKKISYALRKPLFIYHNSNIKTA